MASVGVREIEVVKKPRIALIITGDELSPLELPISKGKIYNSNLYLIENRLAELSAAPSIVYLASDNSGNLAEKIRGFSTTSDLIITTGGVSVGKKDILHETLDDLDAEIIFKGVDIKPGSPAIFSMAGNTPVISLSGNPFAAITTFELLVRPALYKMTGDPVFKTMRAKGVVKSGFCKRSGSRRFIRAVYFDGEVFIPEHGNAAKHSSGSIGSLIGCNCLIDIVSGEISTGDEVDVVILE
jgi:molybdopterin molybdotransferase